MITDIPDLPPSVVKPAMDPKTFKELDSLYKEDRDARAALIGATLSRFMSKQVGQHLLQLATDEIENGVSELLEIDPEDDMKKYREVKLNILVAQRALTWIANTITEGEIAVDKIEREDVERLDGFR